MPNEQTAASNIKPAPKPMHSTPIHETDKAFLTKEAARLGGISLKAALAKVISHYAATVDLTVTITPPAKAEKVEKVEASEAPAEAVAV